MFINYADFYSDAKEGSWILGGGWNNDFWGGELPSASWIDEISPHNPVRDEKYAVNIVKHHCLILTCFPVVM